MHLPPKPAKLFNSFHMAPCKGAAIQTKPAQTGFKMLVLRARTFLVSESGRV